MGLGVARLMGVGAFVSLAASCAPSEATLVIQVRTDLLPGLDFATIRTIAMPPEGTPVTIDESAGDSRPWGGGVRVAELPNLAPGVYAVRVQVLDEGGATLMERPVRVELDASLRVVTVLLTRDCRGIDCSDGAANACLGGRCVPEECNEEDPLACGSPTCTDNLDCPGPGGCARTGECTSGACFVAPDHTMCETPGEACDSSTGMCIGGWPPPLPECSAARIPSPTCGDIGVIRSRVVLGPGMGSMTGTVYVTVEHTADPYTGAPHIAGTSAGVTVSDTVPAEVHLDFCERGAMWSEEDGGYNLWAFLDVDSNRSLNEGDPAGRLPINVSCNALESPCYTIELDCLDGAMCIVPETIFCTCGVGCNPTDTPSPLAPCSCPSGP